MSKVILGGEPVRSEAASVARVPAAFFQLLLAFGLGITGVGLVDLGFAWIPPHFGSGEWEFGTISRTFDSLALITTGLAALLGAAILGGSPVWLRIAGVVFLLAFLALIAACVLYVLNIPPALRAIPPEAKPVLKKAVMRSGLFGFLYVTLYGWLSIIAWRRAGAAKGGAKV